VQGVLAVSRAFGDRTLKPFVIADPELKVRKLEPGDDFLILASDGTLLRPLTRSLFSIGFSFSLHSQIVYAPRSCFTRPGVWDVMSSQEAVDITLGSDSIDAAAKRIVDTASARRSQDNITALIIDTRHFRTRQK
jgi:serine/threonine protein phosphatase PrpC